MRREAGLPDDADGRCLVAWPGRIRLSQVTYSCPTANGARISCQQKL